MKGKKLVLRKEWVIWILDSTPNARFINELSIFLDKGAAVESKPLVETSKVKSGDETKKSGSPQGIGNLDLKLHQTA